MKCRTSRLISTLLALCLAPALLPGTALAEVRNRKCLQNIPRNKLYKEQKSQKI